VVWSRSRSGPLSPPVTFRERRPAFGPWNLTAAPESPRPAATPPPPPLRPISGAPPRRIIIADPRRIIRADPRHIIIMAPPHIIEVLRHIIGVLRHIIGGPHRIIAGRHLMPPMRPHPTTILTSTPSPARPFLPLTTTPSTPLRTDMWPFPATPSRDLRRRASSRPLPTVTVRPFRRYPAALRPADRPARPCREGRRPTGISRPLDPSTRRGVHLDEVRLRRTDIPPPPGRTVIGCLGSSTRAADPVFCRRVMRRRSRIPACPTWSW